MALEFLNTNQGSKSQKSSELKMVKYLCPNNEDITIKIASFIALVQTHMIENVKTNFKEKYKPNLNCNSCKQSECNQKHLLEWKGLIGINMLVTYILIYLIMTIPRNKSILQFWWLTIWRGRKYLKESVKSFGPMCTLTQCAAVLVAVLDTINK